MGTELAAAIAAKPPTANLLQLRDLVTIARLADDRTRIVTAETLRSAGIGRLLLVSSDDHGMRKVKALSTRRLLAKVMPPWRTGLEPSYRFPAPGSAKPGRWTEATGLYRLFDASDALLYVGISNDPLSRLADHARSQPWWWEVARHSVRWYPDRPEAADREITAIWREGPKYNSGPGPASVRQPVKRSPSSTEPRRRRQRPPGKPPTPIRCDELRRGQSCPTPEDFPTLVVFDDMARILLTSPTSLICIARSDSGERCSHYVGHRERGRLGETLSGQGLVAMYDMSDLSGEETSRWLTQHCRCHTSPGVFDVVRPDWEVPDFTGKHAHFAPVHEGIRAR